MAGFADDLTRLVPHMRRFARALVRGHSAQAADDLVQETIVLAMRAERLARGPDLTSWCFATLLRLNRQRDGLQASRAVRPAASDAVPFLPKDVARLDQLTLDEREVLLLTTLVGMNYSQIAATLHVTLDTVMTRLDQARHLLARSYRPSSTPPVAFATARHGRAASHLRLVK